MWSAQYLKWTVGWMSLTQYFNRERNLIWEVAMYRMGNYLFTACESFSVMQNFLRCAPQAANNNSQRCFLRISALTTEFVKTCGFHYIFQAWIQRTNILFPVKRTDSADLIECSYNRKMKDYVNRLSMGWILVRKASWGFRSTLKIDTQITSVLH